MEKVNHEKLDYKYEKLIKSLKALDKSIKVFSSTAIPEEFKSELVASLIKHYEMCFEASCKFLQLYLKQKYNIDLAANMSKTIFKICYENKFIDWETSQELLPIVDARNATTHDYDEEEAHETCKRVSGYYKTFKKLIDFIEKSGYSGNSK